MDGDQGLDEATKSEMVGELINGHQIGGRGRRFLDHLFLVIYSIGNSRQTIMITLMLFHNLKFLVAIHLNTSKVVGSFEVHFSN